MYEWIKMKLKRDTKTFSSFGETEIKCKEKHREKRQRVRKSSRRRKKNYLKLEIN